MHTCLNTTYNYVSVYIRLVYYSHDCTLVCLGCNGVSVPIKDKSTIY